MSNKDGFTLIEILVATSLFVVLVFGMFQFSSIMAKMSKASQAEISINQILYNIKTAITSSAARRATSNLPANDKLRKCVLQSSFDSSECKLYSSETSSPYAQKLVLMDSNNTQIANGDPTALTTIASKYDEFGSLCLPGQITLPGACPIFAQAFFKTLCIDSSASCGSLNETVIIIHYRVLIDPSLPGTSPYKKISPAILSSFRSGKLTTTDVNPNPQLLLSFPAGYFSF